MSKIIKTEAVVLSVIKYSDSSKIASLYTRDHGRVSAIYKGARQKNSKGGATVDPINLIEVIFYNKESREMQTITGADLLDYFPAIKSDFEKLKYSLAITELVNNSAPEHEANERLFSGIKRILERISGGADDPFISFLRFFVFFLTELGFEISVDNCINCGNQFTSFPLGFRMEQGLICNDCLKKNPVSGELDRELFTLLFCLKKGKDIKITDARRSDKMLFYIEKFASYHLTEYRALNSLKI